MSRLFFYKVMYDGGGAPCAFGDVLSLAICKPQIRTTARRGDWIFGFGAQRLGEKLIYIARVDDIAPRGEYYRDPRYSNRPDAVYEWQGHDLRWKEGALYHEPSATEHDVGLPPNYERAVVLVSNEFRYFGRNSTDHYKQEFPVLAESVGAAGRAYRVNHSQQVQSALIALIERTWIQHPAGMILGGPHDEATNACDLPGEALAEDNRKTVARDCSIAPASRRPPHC